MLTKIWIGPELEGFDKGIPTMFIASDVKNRTSFILELLETWKIQRIYLGAGRTDFQGFDNNQLFLDECKNKNISVVIEVDLSSINENISYMINNEDVKVIYTVRNRTNKFPVKKENTYLKYDDFTDVYVFDIKNSSQTSLNDLKGMTFEQDTVIYQYSE